MVRDPELVLEADVLLVESTYGDRDHPLSNVREELARIINEAVARKGALLVPAFAVGRTQELIWCIRELEDAGRIPKVPVFIDSPMATDVTEIFCRHAEDHDIDMKLLMDEHRCPLCCTPYTFTRSAAESKALNREKGPLIIIAASGRRLTGALCIISSTGWRIRRRFWYRVNLQTISLISFVDSRELAFIPE